MLNRMIEIFAIIFLPFLSVIVFAFAAFGNKKKLLKTLPLFFFSAFFAVAASSSVQLLLSSIFPAKNNFAVHVLFSSFIQTALIEELCKLFLFMMCICICTKIFVKDFGVYAGNRKQFTVEEYGGIARIYILFSVFFGLNFAAFENTAYTAMDINSAAVRVVSSTFIHAAMAVYYAKITVYANRKTQLKKCLFLFSVPLTIHGLYNMFIVLGGFFVFFAVIIILFCISVLIKNLFRVQNSF